MVMRGLGRVEGALLLVGGGMRGGGCDGCAWEV